MSNSPIRPPAVAGQFYPGDPVALRKAIRQYVNRASLPGDLGAVRAVIAPHAGYIYSGPIAGYAFKALMQSAPSPTTVFLMGPAHRALVEAVAPGSYSAFQTPLGTVPVAEERIAAMLTRAPFYVRADRAHAVEHSLEVEIPFLQVVLSDWNLLPLLFGRVDAQAVAGDIVDHLQEDDRIVVSTDLSHYHPHETAKDLDNSLLDALLAGDQDRVSQGEACGREPILALMEIARRKGWQPHLLDYRSSGDTAGDKHQVVGYAAVAYTS